MTLSQRSQIRGQGSVLRGQFTDVFSKNEHTQVPLLDRSAPFMNDIAVSKDGVIKLLKGYEISTCQMQYDAADKKTDQEDPCFIYLGGN